MAKKLTTAQKLLVAAIVAVALGVMVWVVVEEQQRDEVPVVPKPKPEVDIYIGYTDLCILKEKMIPTFTGRDYKVYHTFVLAQDRETKRRFITRAGPERKIGDSGCRCCPLFCKQAVSGKDKLWAHSFWGTKECLPTLHKQKVGTLKRSINDVAKQMKVLAEANNTCNSKEYSLGILKVKPSTLTFIVGKVVSFFNPPVGFGIAAVGLFFPHCKTPYNSNSYAFSVVEKLMGRRPNPENPDPKYSRTITVGECEYDRAHGWNEVVNLNGC